MIKDKEWFPERMMCIYIYIYIYRERERERERGRERDALLRISYKINYGNLKHHQWLFHQAFFSEQWANVNKKKHISPWFNNNYGSVGIYISNNINCTSVREDLSILKSCDCCKCEFESLFVEFKYRRKKFILGGLYRHPNGKVNHFTRDLEKNLIK